MVPGLSLGVLWLALWLKLFLSAGPGPLDTASTTEKLWEGFSHRSATSIWCITSGLTKTFSPEKTREMAPGSRRAGMRWCITQFLWFSIWIPGLWSQQRLPRCSEMRRELAAEVVPFSFKCYIYPEHHYHAKQHPFSVLVLLLKDVTRTEEATMPTMYLQ